MADDDQDPFGPLRVRQGDSYTRLGATIGNILFGGPDRERRRRDAFNGGALSGLSLQLKLLEAEKARNENIGRQANAHEAFAHGDTELANLYLSGATAEQVANYRRAKQTMDYRAKIWDLLNQPGGKPDLEAIDRAGLAIGAGLGKTAPLTRIEGGTAFSPFLLPEHQALSPTEVGASQIRQRDAAAAASHAMAVFTAGARTDRENAVAGRNSGRAGSGPSDAVRPLTGEELKAHFGQLDGSIEQTKLGDFYRFAERNNIRDPHDALMRMYGRYGGEGDPPPGAMVLDVPTSSKSGAADEMVRRMFDTQAEGADPDTETNQPVAAEDRTPAERMQSMMLDGAAPVAQSPYREGQRLRNKADGKTYVVRNGQPVPEQ
jgi:hypothetical protein